MSKCRKFGSVGIIWSFQKNNAVFFVWSFLWHEPRGYFTTNTPLTNTISNPAHPRITRPPKEINKIGCHDKYETNGKMKGAVLLWFFFIPSILFRCLIALSYDSFRYKSCPSQCQHPHFARRPRHSNIDGSPCWPQYVFRPAGPLKPWRPSKNCHKLLRDRFIL